MKRFLVAALVAWGLTGTALADIDAVKQALERGDHEAALEELVPLVNAGETAAQVLYGDLHMKGLEKKVIQNYAMAWTWYMRAAEAGDATGQFKVASMYQKGIAVPPDMAKAIEWYRQAADQNHMKAQTRLGLIYLEGLGVKPDRAEAMKWLEKATDQGSLEAERAIDELYASGLLTLPGLEPVAEPDPDTEAGRLHLAVVDMMEALSSQLDGATLTTRGRVRVDVNADYSFDVVVPRFVISFADGSTVIVGTSRFNARQRRGRSPLAAKRTAYRVKVTLPARVRVRPSQGAPEFALTYTQERFTGLWIPALRALVESDIELTGLRFADDLGEMTITAERLVNTHAVEEVAPGKWSGPSRMEVTGISVTGPDRARIVTLGSMTVSTEATGFDIESTLPAARPAPAEAQPATTEPAATEPAEPREQPPVTGLPMALPIGVSADFGFADLAVFGDDGKRLVSLAKLAFGVKAGDMDTPLATFALSYSHNGLEADSPEAVKDADFARLKPFIPLDAALDIDIRRIPVAALGNTMAVVMGKMLAGALTSPGAAPQDLAGAMAPAIAFGLRGPLAEAKTELSIDLSIDAEKAGLDLQGLVHADTEALHGVSGGFDLGIEGYDEILAQAAGDPQAALFVLMLTVMKELAVTETTPEGATVSRFRIDIARDGKLLVNGKELTMMPMAGMAAPAGAAPPETARAVPEARSEAFKECARDAHARDIAAKKEWQYGLRDLIIRERPEFASVATVSMEMQLANVARRETQFAYLLDRHPERIVTDGGISEFRNHEWSDEDKKNLMELNPEYKKIEDNLEELKKKNDAHEDWPVAREFFQKTLPQLDDYNNLMGRFKKKEQLLENLLNLCRPE